MIHDASMNNPVLEEIKRRQVKNNLVDVEEACVKVVIFALQGERFGFYGAHVKEILPLLPIYLVPGAPRFILGIINVRGNVESVLTINAFLGLPDSRSSGQSRIILAEKDSIRSGILVDGLEDVVDVPLSSVKPALATLDNKIKAYVQGEVLYREGNVTILDMGRIFEELSPETGKRDPGAKRLTR